MTQEEYNSMLVSAREQFKQGTPLFGNANLLPVCTIN